MPARRSPKRRATSGSSRFAGSGRRKLSDHQLSQLNQLLGRLKYRPADAVLRSFVPRMERPRQDLVCPEARAAAIWALGLIHEGSADPALVDALQGRLNDAMSLPP